MKILDNKKICIIGGGSSGFMTSLYLTIHHPDKKIILIESPIIPKIGVGEGSTQHIRSFFANMGIDSNEFLKNTFGTYKFSIRFRNFLKQEHEIGIHYPFGDESFDSKYIKAWMNFIAKNKKYKHLTDRVISHQVALCDNNLTGSILNDFNVDMDAAFHFDAILMSDYLKRKNLEYDNFEHIQNTVQSVVKDENGYIEKLILNDGIEIESDLFIDCTGFSRLLIGNEKFHSLSDKLPVNKAWACRLKYNNRYTELKNFTDCVGLNHGWSWLIPLYNRLGCGYVFSNNFTTEEDALIEFKNFLNSKNISLDYNPNRTEDLEFRLVDFQVGYQKEAWQKNYLSIGLAAGFLEPLEANGLLTTHELIKHLSEILIRDKVTNFDRHMFNERCERLIEGWARFLLQHYVITQRDDTEFWRYFNSDDIVSSFMKNSVNFLNPRSTFKENSGTQRIYLGGEVSISNINYESKYLNLPYKMLYEYNRLIHDIHYHYTNNYIHLKQRVHEDI